MCHFRGSRGKARVVSFCVQPPRGTKKGRAIDTADTVGTIDSIDSIPGSAIVIVEYSVQNNTSLPVTYYNTTGVPYILLCVVDTCMDTPKDDELTTQILALYCTIVQLGFTSVHHDVVPSSTFR